MISVTNIKITELNYNDLVNKVSKAFPFLKLSQQDIKEIEALFPDPIFKMTFDLHGASTYIANGFRRTVLDEIEGVRFGTSPDMIKSDDLVCQRFNDNIQSRINLIPISYMDPEEVKGEMFLELKNTTLQPIEIKSDHITAPKNLKIAKHFTIMILNPGKFIHIKLHLERGTNLDHGSYTHFGPALYKPLKFDMKNPPMSMTVIPHDYSLGFHCPSWFDPTKVAKRVWATMIQKLELLQSRIDEFIESGGKVPYNTDFLKVTQIKGDRIKYEIMNETYTISNIISWYTYQRDPSIDLVHAGDDHPQDPSTLIKITHPKHAQLIRDAIGDAIKDIKLIASKF